MSCLPSPCGRSGCLFLWCFYATGWSCLTGHLKNHWNKFERDELHMSSGLNNSLGWRCGTLLHLESSMPVSLYQKSSPKRCRKTPSAASCKCLSHSGSEQGFSLVRGSSSFQWSKVMRTRSRNHLGHLTSARAWSLPPWPLSTAVTNLWFCGYLTLYFAFLITVSIQVSKELNTRSHRSRIAITWANVTCQQVSRLSYMINRLLRHVHNSQDGYAKVTETRNKHSIRLSSSCGSDHSQICEDNLSHLVCNHIWSRTSMHILTFALLRMHWELREILLDVSFSTSNPIANIADVKHLQSIKKF